MKGVLLATCPHARMVDISHAVPPWDVVAGGFVLYAGASTFPAGSLHLAVVDPGVGSPRRALAFEAGGCLFVGPDNGLFWLVLRRHGPPKVVVDLERPAGAAPTFEGRDVFAPAAARLAAGEPLTSLGRPSSPPAPAEVAAQVIWIDRFGNLVTSLEPPVRSLMIDDRPIRGPFRTYSEAVSGEPFWYVGSMGFIEVGVRQGRADHFLAARVGTPAVAS